MDFEEMVRGFVKNRDFESLDGLFTLAFLQTRETGWNKGYFKNGCVERCTEYNLKLKYKIEQNTPIQKLDTLKNIINNTNISKYSIIQLQNILKQNCSSLYKEDITGRINGFEKIDKIVLEFILLVIKDKFYKSKEDALKRGQKGYGGIDGFSVRPWDAERDEDITHFWVNNLLQPMEIDIPTYTSLQIRKNINSQNTFALGDVLVKAGIAYCVPHIDSKGNCNFELIIPKFLYDIGTEIIKNQPESELELSFKSKELVTIKDIFDQYNLEILDKMNKEKVILKVIPIPFDFDIVKFSNALEIGAKISGMTLADYIEFLKKKHKGSPRSDDNQTLLYKLIKSEVNYKYFGAEIRDFLRKFGLIPQKAPEKNFHFPIYDNTRNEYDAYLDKKDRIFSPAWWTHYNQLKEGNEIIVKVEEGKIIIYPA